MSTTDKAGSANILDEEGQIKHASSKRAPFQRKHPEDEPKAATPTIGDRIAAAKKAVVEVFAGREVSSADRETVDTPYGKFYRTAAVERGLRLQAHYENLKTLHQRLVGLQVNGEQLAAELANLAAVPAEEGADISGTAQQLQAAQQRGDLYRVQRMLGLLVSRTKFAACCAFPPSDLAPDKYTVQPEPGSPLGQGLRDELAHRAYNPPDSRAWQPRGGR